MICASCQKDNKEEETQCVSCGANLKPNKHASRVRSRRKDPQGSVSPETEACNRAVWRAYRFSMLSLIPGLGLVLGPVAFTLGNVVRFRCRRDPDFNLWGPLLAAIAFGAVVTVCNWAGFTLMYLGLRSVGVL